MQKGCLALGEAGQDPACDLGSQVVCNLGIGDHLEGKPETGASNGVPCQVSMGRSVKNPEQFCANQVLDKVHTQKLGMGGNGKAIPVLACRRRPLTPVSQ